MLPSTITTGLLGALTLMLACGAPVAAPPTASEGAVTGLDEAQGGASEGAVTGPDEAQGGASPVTSVEPDWCAARVVIQAKCQRCHGEPTENGAPFALVTYADTQVTDRKGVPRYERMKAAVESAYMPPQFLELSPAVQPLTASESDTLITWLSAQPPLDSRSCD